MKNNDFYKKHRRLPSHDKNINMEESLKTIKYSIDPRDFGQVASSIPCQKACPAGTNIPGYIRCIHEKRYGRSYEVNRLSNILPGVLGRICSRPCEEACRHGESDLGESPVGICNLKRTAADLKSPMHRIMEGLYSPSGKRVAVVGAGPAGLGAAHELAVLGHKVSLYESRENPGGMLMYGIPEFRLPRNVLSLEIENILRLGVDIFTGISIGEDITLDKLLNDFDAVVIATGCTTPNKLNVPGENLENVYSGLDFMEQFNSGKTPYIGTKVMVIGDGFTAMDCSRAAVRLGATDVVVNIRKTEEYMPIDDHEKFEVKFEKIKFSSLVDTCEILGKNGKVSAIKLRSTKLEYSPEPPYRNAVPIEDSEITVPADSVIVAIGQRPDPAHISDKIKNFRDSLSPENNYQGNIENLFYAGDFSTGSSNVITAIAEGRKCAHAIDEHLTGRQRKISVVRLENVNSTDRDRSFDFIERERMNTIPLETRIEDGNNEVETGLTEDQAFEESKRCYLCSLKYEIDTSVCIYCSACIDVAPRDCIKMIENIEVNQDGSYGEYIETNDWNKVLSIAIDSKRCIRCGKCHEVCPVDCISVTKTELIELNIEE